MANRVLLDANIILRFLTKDHEEHFQQSKEIFYAIERGEIEAMLSDFILAEVVYVLKRIYKHTKSDIASALKKLLLFPHLYTDNKLVTFEALDIYTNQNIDFADALLCAKKHIEGYTIISFDKDIDKC